MSVPYGVPFTDKLGDQVMILDSGTEGMAEIVIHPDGSGYVQVNNVDRARIRLSREQMESLREFLGFIPRV